ncbi:MAG: energy-coupling factor transport system permease protein [Clostridiales bacterium]|jgi:energy-coupling factor transport system permease protein|nr:energy-coupling factor transport system permease protein [Clostridiales bacterium]MDN5299839.1 energy-coupling factor transport system permease protein [Clostridiales bacterium]
MENFNFGYTNSPYLWMDPRSKALLFLAANFALWGGTNYFASNLFFVFIVLLLINGKQTRMAMTAFVIYFAFLAIDVVLISKLSGTLSILLLTIFRVTRLYMPVICAAILLIRTTTVSEFVAAFKRMGLSDKIIIPFSVMFRFFPTLGEEWRNIRNAMRFRGIRFDWQSIMLSPIKTLEYVIVPLLMSTVKISGDLSAASISRGLGGPKERTCFKQIRFGILDYGVVILSSIFMIFTILNGV